MRSFVPAKAIWGLRRAMREAKGMFTLPEPAPRPIISPELQRALDALDKPKKSPT
jgi:hypothetical protein